MYQLFVKEKLQLTSSSELAVMPNVKWMIKLHYYNMWKIHANTKSNAARVNSKIPKVYRKTGEIAVVKSYFCLSALL